MVSTAKVVLGCVSFLVFLAMAVLPSVPSLPVGRTTGTLLSAAMMVIFKVLSPDEAFAAIDLSVLALLFGMMLVCAFLERANFFKYIEHLLSWRCRGGRDLLCRVCVLAGVISALLTNDATCVLLTSFLLDLCKRQNLPPQPFLMALATSSNIGSAATPIGNPQNVIIALQGNISFGKFLAGIIAPVIAGLVLNTLLLLLLYWRKLSRPKNPDCPVNGSTRVGGNGADDSQVRSSLDVEFESASGQVSTAEVAPRLEDGCQGADAPPRDEGTSSNEYPPDADVERGLELPEMPFMRHRGGCLSEGSGQSGAKQGIDERRRSWSLHDGGDLNKTEGGSRRETLTDSGDVSRQRGSGRRSGEEMANEGRVGGRVGRLSRDTFLSVGVYCVTLGMLVCLLLGLNLPWVAVSAAIIMLCLDFRDGQAMLDKVSYTLLVFFVGMFVSVQGFNATGLPRKLWDAVSLHATLSSVSGTAVLSAIILLLSNVASNVPTVLLLGPLLAASASITPGVSVTRAWLVLAWVSTVAGNFLILGSAANLIVSEQAIRAGNNSYRLSFWNHLRFGIPSTVLVIAVGLPLVQG